VFYCAVGTEHLCFTVQQELNICVSKWNEGLSKPFKVESTMSIWKHAHKRHQANPTAGPPENIHGVLMSARAPEHDWDTKKPNN